MLAANTWLLRVVCASRLLTLFFFPWRCMTPEARSYAPQTRQLEGKKQTIQSNAKKPSGARVAGKNTERRDLLVPSLRVHNLQAAPVDSPKVFVGVVDLLALEFCPRQSLFVVEYERKEAVPKETTPLGRTHDPHVDAVGIALLPLGVHLALPPRRLELDHASPFQHPPIAYLLLNNFGERRVGFHIAARTGKASRKHRMGLDEVRGSDGHWRVAFTIRVRRLVSGACDDH